MLIPLVKTLTFLLPDPIALRLAVFLASLAPRVPCKPEDRRILESAERLLFGTRPARVAWRWGRGPTVVLVHGWGGRAGQMVKLADVIARSGFQVVVFDGQGHGESEGKRIGFKRLIEDIQALDHLLDSKAWAWVCHSAGGLCLAASGIGVGQRANRLVFLATPRGPYIPINELQQHLNLRATVLDRCRQFYAGEFDMSWDALDQCRAFTGLDQADVLLIEDKDDPRVETGDAERIARVCGRARVMATRGLGHLKILWSAKVARDIVEFLRASKPSEQVEKDHGARTPP